MNLNKLKILIEQKRGQFQQLELEKKQIITKTDVLTEERNEVEQARTVLQMVAQLTQQQIESYIEDVVTMALSIVFDESYNFRVKFIQKRNKTECDLYLEQNGNRVETYGGGVRNVMAFALRVGLLNLTRNDKVLLLDEPFHFLHSKILQQRVSELLQVLSKQFKLQLIMITGEESEEIISNADKVFKVVKTKGVSNVL